MHRSASVLVALLSVSACDAFQERLPLEADGGSDASFEPEPEPEPDPRDAEAPDRADASTPPAPQPDAGQPTVPEPPTPPVEPPAPGPDGGPAPEQPVAADTYGITSRARLVRFERASGKLERGIAITGLRDAEQILGADIRPANGKLYALTDAARVYDVDLQNAAATLAAELKADPNDTTAPFAALSGKRFGVDWNPVADRLRVVSDAGENLRIDVSNGNTTTDGAISPPDRKLTAAAYTQSFATACRTRLLVIDSAARRLLLQDPPNAGVVSDLGGLGDGIDEIWAFEIQTGADGRDSGFLAVPDLNGVRLLDLDLRTGATSNPRPVQLEFGETLLALSAAPPSTAPAQAPGELLGLSESQRLISFNRGAPGRLCSSAEISGLATGERVLGFDVRPADGKLYALASSAKLYTIAVPTGAATLAATLMADAADTTAPLRALTGSEFGVGFNPVADRLRVIGDDGQNLRINVATGATTTDVASNGSSTGASALAYTNAFAGTKTTTLFALDRTQAALARVGGDPATGGACTPEPADPNNPNCGATRRIGLLDVEAGASIGVGGFEIDGKSASAFAALTVGSATTSTLYAIDLVTGKAALPAGVANATIGGGEPLRSLTFAALPSARGFAVTADCRLLTFDLATPSAPSGAVAITGLQDGERVLGIDVRPADGKLYAAGSSGRLYTLDPSTGGATLVAPLAAASGDDQPFAGFGATAHGVDFNPAADLLRVVDGESRNFRIVPSPRNELKTGDVLSDALLNPGAPAIAAAAYTDSYASSPWTTLYVIDAARDTLFLQGGTQGTPSPNGGTLTAVGMLGVDASGDVGFDIAGGHDGLAVAVVQTAGGPAQLYSVSLSAGWLTPFNVTGNTIGGEGVGPIAGFAIELK